MDYAEYVSEKSMEELRDFFTSPPGQLIVAEFHEEKLKPLQAEEAWTELCESIEGFRVTPELLYKVDEVLYRFDIAAAPGHDIGHFQRDHLAAHALKRNFREVSLFPQEVEASFVAAGRHDTSSCAVFPRYADLPMGHAEVGAFVYYHALEKVLPEPVRRLGSYSVSAHKHVGDEKQYDEPIRYKWEALNDSMFEGEDGKLVRTSPWFVRACDRLDGSNYAHAARHILANADMVEQGYVGEDITAQGSERFEVNFDTLVKTFDPIARESAWNKMPTLAEHIRDFANSQDGSSKYSENDHLFWQLQSMMKVNRDYGHAFVESVVNPKLEFDALYSEHRLSVNLAGFLRVVSGSPKFERAWPIIWQALQMHPERIKRIWFDVTYLAELHYADWVNYVAEEALLNSESEFKGVIKGLRLSALS